MPLGRVYIPPPTTPTKYMSNYPFPVTNHVSNIPNGRLDDEDTYGEENENSLIRNNNFRNNVNPNSLNFSYDVNISNGLLSKDNKEKDNLNKAFRKIEIKILDTKYFKDEEDADSNRPVINGTSHGILFLLG